MRRRNLGEKSTFRCILCTAGRRPQNWYTHTHTHVKILDRSSTHRMTNDKQKFRRARITTQARTNTVYTHTHTQTRACVRARNEHVLCTQTRQLYTPTHACTHALRGLSLFAQPTDYRVRSIVARSPAVAGRSGDSDSAHGRTLQNRPAILRDPFRLC